jgi:hypothetical protein
MEQTLYFFSDVQATILGKLHDNDFKDPNKPEQIALRAKFVEGWIMHEGDNPLL